MEKLTYTIIKTGARPKQSELTDKDYYLCSECGNKIKGGEKYYRLLMSLKGNVLKEQEHIRLLCERCKIIALLEIRESLLKKLDEL